jgi:uncharacterized Zn-binding protein involved in type VI secretion
MSLPQPPPAPPPQRPPNALQRTAQAVGAVVGLPAAGVSLVNDGFATATASIGAVFPAFPAATLGSLALGLPHAHPAHPPSGPPPVPPTPLPPVGTILFGTCVSVLVGGLPAARCGDLGLNPTCCGLPPIFEVFTGSSKVFIGGGRAARVTDLTFHCKPTPPAGVASRGVAAAMKAAMIAGQVASAARVAGDAEAAGDASAAGDAAMAQAMAVSSAVGAAQMASDAVAMAMGAVMGKDPCVPPGTLGAIAMGVPNVLIGGFPMPSWMNVARGAAKLARGLRARSAARAARRSAGRGH